MAVHPPHPYSKDLATLPDNLITLCRTCHDGMEDVSVDRQDELQDKISLMAARYHRGAHARGVTRYRNLVRSFTGIWSTSFPSAVLPLEWNWDLPISLKLVHGMLCGNAVAIHYKLGEWRRIVARACEL